MSVTPVAPVAVTPQENADDLGYRIMVISEIMTREMNKRFEERHITDAQTRIIDFVAASGGSARQRDIQAYLQVSHPTVVGLLKRMVDKGFIKISQSSNDMRANIIVLLDDGRVEYDRVQSHREEIEKILTSGLSKSEIDQLSVALDKVLLAFEAESNK